MLFQMLVAAALADDPPTVAVNPDPRPVEPPVIAAAHPLVPPPPPVLPDDVKAVVDAHQAETAACAEQYKGDGAVAVDFRIEATRVGDVQVANSTTVGDSQAKCVADAVSSWRFKKVPDQDVRLVVEQKTPAD